MRNVIIAGLTASGKTTQAMHLAQALGLQYVSGSSIRSRHLGISEELAADPQFWRDSTRGGSIDHARLLHRDPGDKAVDDELIAIAKSSEDCVFDTWGMPWLFREKSLCIYLRSPLHTRARRLFRSSQLMSFEEVLHNLEQKDRLAQQFFLAAYGVDIVSDMSPFDVIVDSNEQDDDATQCISTISDHLSTIASIALSGDGHELQQFLLSVSNNKGRSVKITTPCLTM